MRSMLRAALVAAMAAALAAACAPRATAPSENSASTPSEPTVAGATTTPVTTGVPATAPRPATTGTIAGLLGYPAEGHPAVTIYAISTTDRGAHFSVDIPRATTPPRSPFTITGVRPGTYNLFAYLEGNDGPAGGAYTEFVRCGLRVGCTDHTPIDVTVRAGETVRDIEVSDWYAPPGAFPPRPR